MEDKSRPARIHKVNMEDRKRASFTGINDVATFDAGKMLLYSECGTIQVKGANLHVNRLSVEKGELEIEGRIDSITYSESGIKKNESFINRLLR